MKNSDLIGLSFYRWKATGPLVSRGTGRGKMIWCHCKCGNKSLVDCWSLKSGYSKSCGCYLSDWCKSNKFKHGMSNTRTWHCWLRMIYRCTKKQNKNYKHYGGRGIKVCKRWIKFENFLNDMGEIPINKSIGRIDNNGNYEKSNCRWESKSQQNRNYRRNHIITHKNKSLCLAEWSELTGIKATTIRRRLKYGWSIKDALS